MFSGSLKIDMLRFVVLLCHSPLVKNFDSFGFLGLIGLVEYPSRSALAASTIDGLKILLGIWTGGRIHLIFEGFARYLKLQYNR